MGGISPACPAARSPIRASSSHLLLLIPTLLAHRRLRGGKHHPGAWSASAAGGGATEPLPTDGGAHHLPDLHRQPHPPSVPVRPWGMRTLWFCAQCLPHLPPAHPRPHSDLRVSAFCSAHHGPSTKPLYFIKRFSDFAACSCSIHRDAEQAPAVLTIPSTSPLPQIHTRGPRLPVG